jgi:uncharacterized membrane protein
MVTVEELLGAINAVGLTAQQLTQVLGSAGALVTREKIRAAIAAKRLEAQQAAIAFEAEIQALEAAFVEADKAV